MKKYKQYIVRGLVTLGAIPLLYLTFVFVAEQVTLNYINRQLGTNTRDWLELYQAFESHFQLGSHRDEVVATLLELDPRLADDLQSEEELKSSFFCRNGECSERIIPFQEIIPIVGSTARFDYGFHYNQEDMRLVGMSGPASAENIGSE